MRPDIIEGKVLHVLDGGIFELEVHRRAPGNRLDYAPTERVRASMVKARPAGAQPDGAGPRERVLGAIDGREVKVLVHARDPENLVFGDVELLQ